jgi:glycerophosphoryl diester phosphodiesterase
MLQQTQCYVYIMVLTVAFAPSTLQAQQIVAHRGASHDAPENTLAAFELAWQQQADAIEGDFYLTADGHIVCIHDKDTARVSPLAENLLIAQSGLEELRKLDVGSWKGPEFSDQRIPTLREVLSLLSPGKRILIEIKCGPEILPELEKQISESIVKPDQVTIIAFSPEVIKKSRLMMPQYKANWLTSYNQDTDSGSWTPSLETVLNTLRATGATGLGTNGNSKVIDQAFANTIKEAGFELHVWTVNNPQDAQYWRSLGVHSITTDRPGFIRQQLGL